MEKLADRVRQRMAALELTQEGLASRCGVAQPQITRLLSGSVDRPSYIYELSVALGKSVKWLLTGEEDNFEKYIEFTMKYRELAEAFESAPPHIRESVRLQLGIKDDSDGKKDGKRGVIKKNGTV